MHVLLLKLKWSKQQTFFAVPDFLDHSYLQISQIMKQNKPRKKWKNAKTKSIDNLYLK